jgi:YD repeat-containing protein
MEMKIKYLLFFCFSLISVFALGQSITNNTVGNRVEVPKIVPPSPEAASLGKFGNVPVGLFTGIPSISVPLFEIDAGEIKIPVTISYHSSGLKVDEVSTNVGLGWTLTTGGSVSATIIGHPDFSANGFVRSGNRVRDNLNPDYYLNLNDYETCKKISNGEVDGEPDVYSFNFLGVSGKFVLDHDGNVNIIPNDKKLQISISDPGGVTIIDPNGIKYLFTTAEFVTNLKDNINCPEPLTSSASVTNYSSSWYLTKIILTNGEEILFEYESKPYTVLNNDSEVHYEPFPDNNYCSIFYPNPRKCKSQTSYSGIRIKSIKYKTTEAQFGYDLTDRLDLKGATRLKSVKLLEQTSIIKQFELYQSYFSAPGYPSSSLPDLEKNLHYRLKLDSIKEVGKMPYTFNYNMPSNISFPQRLSYSQDFWGFYNGKSNNALIPAVSTTTPVGSLDGANRTADHLYAGLGLISQVIYPTGGSSVFEYEPNTYYGTQSIVGSQQFGKAVFPLSGGGISTESFEVTSLTRNLTVRYSSSLTDPQGIVNSVGLTLTGPNNFFASYVGNSPSQGVPLILPPGIYSIHCSSYDPEAQGYLGVYWEEINTSVTTQNWPGPGLRVFKIKDEPVIGNKLIKRYSYSHPANGTESSGRVTSLPSFGSVQYFPRVNTITNPGGGTPTYYIDPQNPCKYYVRYSTSQIPLSAIQGADVGYEYVTEEMLDDANNSIGKSVSRFFMPVDLGGSPNAYPFAPPTSNDWLRGLLLEKNEYKKTATGFQIINQITNKYKIYNNYESFFDYKVNPYVNEKNILGVKVATWFNEISNGFTFLPAEYKLEYFKFPSAWFHIDSTLEKSYDETGTISLTVSKKYYYNSNWLQMIKTETRDSKGLLITNESKYPFDFTGTTVYNTMINRNMINKVVESKVFRNNTLLSTTKNNYSLWNANNLALPSLIQSAQYNNTLENEIEFQSYNLDGTVSQFKGKDGIITSYTWGYNQQYPTAKAINAKSSEIFFDGFEETGKWGSGITLIDNTFKRTGLSSGKIDKQTVGEQTSQSTQWLSISLTAPKKFKYSGWVYSNAPSAEIFLFMRRATDPPGASSSSDNVFFPSVLNKWVYVEKEVTVPADVVQLTLRVDNNGGGIVWFDDIRVQPSDAFMTSYTYKPLVGMTSETDPNNKTKYYEYDALGRLTLVFDQNRNILRKICYNYNGQTENCTVPSYGNTSKSGTFTRNNCAGGLVGSSVTYTVPANTYFSTISPQDAEDQAQADVNANGQAYANTNGTCSTPCSITGASTINLLSSTISSSAGVVSFYMVFNATTTLYPNTSYWVATINGGCKPTTSVSFSASFAGRIWNIVIDPDGKMYFKIVSGSPYPPASTNSTGTLTYNL